MNTAISTFSIQQRKSKTQTLLCSLTLQQMLSQLKLLTTNQLRWLTLQERSSSHQKSKMLLTLMLKNLTQVSIS